MIFRLILLLLLPVIAYYLVSSLSSRLSLTARQNRYLFFLTSALLVIVVLILMGRLPVQFILAPIGVAITFLMRMLPTLLRLLPMWQMFRGRVASAMPRDDSASSTIRTTFLEVELKHSSGDMDGKILAGEFSGSSLSQLKLEQLLILRNECGGDTDSVQVLEAYLDRMHSEWHEQASEASGSVNASDEAVMSTELALEILGLDEIKDKKAVVAAHRNLMQKLHPDRGGSDYFAKKINAAKDFLLKSL